MNVRLSEGRDALLASKLRQGAPLGLIDRPHLSAGLTGERLPRLTLVTAPAGYGKSCLLHAMSLRLAAAERAFGWLSLDQDDEDPVRLLSYLALAVDAAVAGAGRTALEICGPASSPPMSWRFAVCWPASRKRTGRWSCSSTMPIC